MLKIFFIIFASFDGTSLGDAPATPTGVLFEEIKIKK